MTNKVVYKTWACYNAMILCRLGNWFYAVRSIDLNDKVNMKTYSWQKFYGISLNESEIILMFN